MELSFLKQIYLGNTLSTWAIALSLVFGSVLMSRILSNLIKKIGLKLTKKTKTQFDDILFEIIQKPMSFLIMILGSHIGLGVLQMSESIEKTERSIFFVLITLNVAWVIDQVFGVFFEHILKPMTEKTESNLDDQILPIARKLTKYVVWTLAVIIGLDNAGYDIATILAGLGIGGLAFALAAQDSVSNVFGGLTIFLDKPFIINDRIEMDGIDGVIKEIGIRSTKVKQLDGRIVTVPNSKFTDNPIKNISSEPNRKVSLTLGLTYDMDHKQIIKAMDVLKEIATETNGVQDTSVTAFTAFNSYSLDVSFIYYIKKSADIFQTQTKVNLEVLRRFNELGLEMAFPTQTLMHQGPLALEKPIAEKISA